MAKIIKLPVVKQRQDNLNLMKVLVDQYVKVNKKEVLQKLKAEQ